jgi:NAD(P)-dependent dehydrogenase (short-subunit alcohol dehydrogenase family)
MLQGKVVAITGAGRGIGREMALLCAKNGAAVVVNDFGTSASGDEEAGRPADSVVAEIKAAGGKAHANHGSVAEPDQAASIIEDAVRVFGRIDGVVNNAGFLRDAIFHKMSIHDFESVVRVHLFGSFYVAKAAAQYFRNQGGGSYVHFASASGIVGNVGQANYSAAKLGIVALSNSIALDMQRFGVRSNCIVPFAWSRLVATLPEKTEAERQRVERFKAMSADKIAPLPVYLLSDEAVKVTGQIFCVRKNEIFLCSHPRPIRSMHRSEGWTPETIARELVPAFTPSFQPLQRSADVFCWDPI